MRYAVGGCGNASPTTTPDQTPARSGRARWGDPDPDTGSVTEPDQVGAARTRKVRRYAIGEVLMCFGKCWRIATEVPNPQCLELLRQCAAAWGAAHQAAGASPETAQGAAANTSVFYAPDAPSSRRNSSAHVEYKYW